eukprot:jgi/Mesen1/387/ME000010S_10844
MAGTLRKISTSCGWNSHQESFLSLQNALSSLIRGRAPYISGDQVVALINSSLGEPGRVLRPAGLPQCEGLAGGGTSQCLGGGSSKDSSDSGMSSQAETGDERLADQLVCGTADEQRLPSAVPPPRVFPRDLCGPRQPHQGTVVQHQQHCRLPSHRQLQHVHAHRCMFTDSIGRLYSTAGAAEGGEDGGGDGEGEGGELDETSGASSSTEDEEDGLVAKDRVANELVTDVKDAAALTSVEGGKYFLISNEDRLQYLGSTLPKGMPQEFEATKCGGVLIRESTLHLIHKVQEVLSQLQLARQSSPAPPSDDADTPPAPSGVRVRRRHFLLEGLHGSGKSFALATAVLWARANGWLTFYVPRAKEWTSGGFFYKHPGSEEWDTPVQARTVLQAFRNSNKDTLATLPVRATKTLALGEGPGTGLARGPQTLTLKEGSTLLELVERGLDVQQAAVSAVVSLRAELALVTEVPVLIAIDEPPAHHPPAQLTFQLSCAPVHAFRPMAGTTPLANGIILAAMSESMGVGQMAPQLPGVPKKVRYEIPRFSLAEAEAAVAFYRSRGVILREPDADEVKRLFYLTNGNGAEIRKLAYMLS